MRKRGRTLLFALTLACALGMWGVCALAHSHLDSGEGYVLYNSYVAPTEDQDGTTGPGTCSVCGEVVVEPVPIPSLSRQRQAAGPTEAPAPAATPAVQALPSTLVETIFSVTLKRSFSSLANQPCCSPA